jgi:hypothetical protein
MCLLISISFSCCFLIPITCSQFPNHTGFWSFHFSSNVALSCSIFRTAACLFSSTISES